MSLINKFDNNLNVINKILKKIRLERGLSYESLSTKLELMGISIHKQCLYDIENNKRTVKDYELFGISEILKVDMNELFLEMKKKFE